MYFRIKSVLNELTKKGASDLHLCPGIPPTMRLNGRLTKLGTETLENNDISLALQEVLPRHLRDIKTGEEIDLAIAIKDVGRFRTNVYHDQRGLCVAIRILPDKIPSVEELGLPKIVNQVCKMHRGLVIVTGPTGSGKSTTLAAIINKINAARSDHIITIEDPIEFMYTPQTCIINQREIGSHTSSFPKALREALREDPDILLVGEMRDIETIAMTVTAAETGHLVLATLHTRGATESIDRIIDVFPPHQQDQIRLQLADSLEMVISQVLIPSKDWSARYLACEIMVGTLGTRNLIREKATHQIKTAIQTGTSQGMQTLESALKRLVLEGKITQEMALPWVSDKILFESL